MTPNFIQVSREKSRKTEEINDLQFFFPFSTTIFKEIEE